MKGKYGEQGLTSETFEVIEKLSNIDFSGFHKESTQTGGNYSMCRAMEEMLEDAKNNGFEKLADKIAEKLERFQMAGA